MGEVIKLEQYEESIRLLEQKAIKAKYWVGEERGENLFNWIRLAPTKKI